MFSFDQLNLKFVFKFPHLIELETSINLFILFILADNEIFISKTAIAQSWVYKIIILQG